MTKWPFLAVNFALAFGLYWPLYKRILQRKTTGDYSKPAQWMIFAVQVNNLGLALLTRNWYFMVIYIAHAIMVGFTIWLVYRYYDN